MVKKIFAQLLVVLLMLFPVQAAFGEELAWPDDIEDEWSEEMGEIYDEDVVAWYDAMDVYDMFANCPVDIDYDQPNSDGTMFLVTDDRFTSIESLLNFACLYFSDEIAQRLIDKGMYGEEDGHLFARDIINYLDENIDEIIVLPQPQDDRVEYAVTVSYLTPNDAGETEREYSYARERFDGQWRFIEFPDIT